MPIPRRIIQTQRDPAIQQELRQSWQALHPAYDYLFFDDAQCRALVAERTPEFLATYDALPLPVQKADLFRYAAVYALGGLYVDVDTVCHAPLHSYVDLDTEALVICPEMLPSDWPQGWAGYVQRFCVPQQFGQWAFCAPAGHPVLRRLLERIRYFVSCLPPQELVAASRMAFFTLELTGPRVFTHVMHEFLSGGQQASIHVLPRRAWAAWPWERQAQPTAADIKLTHLFTSAWWPSKQGAQPQKPPQRPGPRIRYDLRY